MKIIKQLIIIILTITLLSVPLQASAATPTRYTTQTLKLRDKPKGKILRKVKRNTAVKVVKVGKNWVRIKYKGKKYTIRKGYLHKLRSPKKYTGAYLKRAGAIWWKGQKFTWYSQRVLPDPNNYLGIVGKHIDNQGFICDKWNYIVLGSNTANRGKIIATPFGKFGKVYDAGYVGTYWFDCYTNF